MLDTVSNKTEDLSADVAAISRLDAVASILEVVCRCTGMGFAAVARVTESRWVACAVRDEIAFGLEPGGELKVETTICDEIRNTRLPVVIDNVAEDPLYRNHHTPAIYGLQSYISMPIFRTNGAFFGTLCAIDPRPAHLNKPEIVKMFRLFADLIGFHLEAQDRAVVATAALMDERQTAELREQFIAVLGHDLRNPLASIEAGTRLLRKEALSGNAHTILGHVQKSARRMGGLIDDMLDFARGRMGGGFALHCDPARPLVPVLEQVVDEFRDAHPDRIFETRFLLADSVNCDIQRVGQLLSNLVGNALKHGAPDSIIRISASSDKDAFVLAVANKGNPIDPLTLRRLFLPFFRAETRSTHKGLGLGLYIASEIARAHGGTLDVVSSSEETCFTLRIPGAIE